MEGFLERVLKSEHGAICLTESLLFHPKYSLGVKPKTALHLCVQLPGKPLKMYSFLSINFFLAPVVIIWLIELILLQQNEQLKAQTSNTQSSQYV